MSLAHGGVFDPDHNWAPPHAKHRMGTNVDLRTVVLSSAQVKYVRLICEDSLSGSVFDETGGGSPHYHLRH